MNVANRILSVVLSLVLAASFCPALAYADEIPATSDDEIVESVLAEDVLKFIYVDANVVHLGETQYIAVALDDEFADLEDASLLIKRESDGSEMRLPATNMVGASVLFAKTFDSADDFDSYALYELRFTVDNREYVLDLKQEPYATTPAVLVDADDPASELAESADVSDSEFSPVGAPIYAFDVQAATVVVEASEDAEAEQVTVFALDDEEQLTQTGDIQTGLALASDASPDQVVGQSESHTSALSDDQAIDQSDVQVSATTLIDKLFGVETAYALQNGRIVVALDPGHGGSDGGAVYGDLLEKDVNLRIAQYCAQVLSGYSDVIVYMTRTDDSYVTLTNRAEESVARGADIVVSIHCNATTSHSATGAEVWVPNTSSWKYEETHVVGAELGSMILDNLAALGLNRRGVFTRDCTNNSEYPDGSLEDYFTVISRSREEGVPAIIVEHAFIDCDPDYSRLHDDSFLKRLGEADAQAIIDYFGINNFADVPATFLPFYDLVRVKAWYAGNDGSRGGYFPGSDTLYLDYTLSKGLMSGYAGRSEFGPEDTLSRGMVATVIYRAFTGNTAATTDNDVDAGFSDVARGEWYAAAVKWCAENGIVTGYSGTTEFGPDDPVTREQMATMVGRWLSGYKGMTAASADAGLGFSDADDISGYAREYVAFCVEHGIMSGIGGTGRFDPASFAQRAQMAKVIAVAMRLLEESDLSAADFMGIKVNATPIMGASQTTVDQMVRRYNAVGFTYPATVYAQYGAPTIHDFCTILLQEANDEGLRAEVLFAQIMHETGWLQFGGDVQAEQCNFGGLGATGNGEPGCAFNDWGTDSVRKGIRAQVQHLKAYASTDDCVHEIVDPRFRYVNRGCAPTVQDLGGTWAADTSYGTRLNAQIDALLAA